MGAPLISRKRSPGELVNQRSRLPEVPPEEDSPMTTYQEVVTEMRPPGGVVVGDDGSPTAEVALRYALDEARRRNTDLHVIRAWRIPTALSTRPPTGYVPALSELEAATREDLQHRVDRVLGHPEDVKLHVHAVYAPAARALISASESADVVVVGSRGLGGFASLLLGSVADQCTRHCASPVIVVRQRRPLASDQDKSPS
jgi:nucleotide-binding universal stress UspA family protein